MLYSSNSTIIFHKLEVMHLLCTLVFEIYDLKDFRVVLLIIILYFMCLFKWQIDKHCCSPEYLTFLWIFSILIIYWPEIHQNPRH